MQGKDLMIVEKIEQKLRKTRKPEENIFPLSPTHRKELRQLRDENISGIQKRLHNIKKLKTEEFFKKYKEKISQKTKIIDVQVTMLTKAYEKMREEINKKIKSMKELEETCDLENIRINSGWGNLEQLKEFNETRRYSRNEEAVERKLKKMFEEKFGEKFEEVQQKIDKMLEQYEEAINFGDLEIVKELYYSLKDADGFLNEVSKIKV